MSFDNSWVNEYHSLIQIKQDPVNGMLTGLYSSTTGGTGTYDVVGWASLQDPTEKAGQPMAITVLWRSNDGGKSDPSHEVSAMAGQVITIKNGLQLSLVHVFVETDPVSAKIEAGFYPDKLIFSPDLSIHNLTNNIGAANPADKMTGVNISGQWLSDSELNDIQSLNIVQPDSFNCSIKGMIVYKDGKQFELIGFTDIYAKSGNLVKQSIGFSTYIDHNGNRTCISHAGYLDIETGKLCITCLNANSTSNDANYTQVNMNYFQFYTNNDRQ